MFKKYLKDSVQKFRLIFYKWKAEKQPQKRKPNKTALKEKKKDLKEKTQ